MNTTSTIRKYLIMMFCSLVLYGTINAQKVVEGYVIDAQTREPIQDATVTIKGTFKGKTTDQDGYFDLEVYETLPYALVLTRVGYEIREIEITDSLEKVSVDLRKEELIKEEVVVAASRIEEDILSSPISVEKLTTETLRHTPAADFYTGLAEIKGVQMTTSSLVFPSINTRGFANIANTRFVQLIDNMDNAPPGLNFAIGNLVGISELDVDNVELIPGTASALYGPNAFNGILFINSKDPFQYQGLTAFVRTGATEQKAAGLNPFGEIGIRFAKAFNENFAFKFNAYMMRGTDWHSDDYRDVDNSPMNEDVRGTNSPSYDGLNTYGDEVATTLDLDRIAGVPMGTYGKIRVARTGYDEADIADYSAESYKISMAFHYRLTDSIRLIGDYRYGLGSTIFQGANKHAFKNTSLQQFKLELREKDHFFIRGYSSLENAGDSYDIRLAAWNLNKAWKSDEQWFSDYAQNYILSQDHNAARSQADQGRLEPNSFPFYKKLNSIIISEDFNSGARFIDKTRLVHLEGNYNLGKIIKFMDILVGGNFRQYSLNSEGTLFNDLEGRIKINEFGVYTQGSHELWDRLLKLTWSLRYDKNQNFEGQFNPRASMVWALDEKRHNFLRASFQTGFRNPDTQGQYIGVNLGNIRVLGGTEDNILNYSTSVPYLDPMNNAQQETVTGVEVYENAYTANSVQAFLETNDETKLEKIKMEFLRPERVVSYEVGYKGVINKRLFVDMSAYYNQYYDFIANTNIVHPLLGTAGSESGIEDIEAGRTALFQLYTNAASKIRSHGFALGLDYIFPRGYRLMGSYNYSNFTQEKYEADLQTGFNNPKNRFSVSVGNRNLYKGLGFNLNYRWSEGYLWQSAFGVGDIPKYDVLSAQISYVLPQAQTTIIKVGVSNILGKEYRTALGAPTVGKQAYISITFDDLFNLKKVEKELPWELKDK